ncbi:MAG: c-type cytochrome [Burkholderiaceae bacterium]|jgi:cytochrome c peroxidase|nr:c-type cytochrome [Burkholderiaceae bacterium]
MRRSGFASLRRAALVAATRIGSRIALAVATGVFLPASAQPAPAVPEWTATERARIASHGPWPPRASVDRSNRVSGQPAAIAFGQRLFFDGRLSRSGVVSCAWCHQPERAWTDGRATAQAVAAGDRNTQSLLNLAPQRWFGWGGSSDSLWMASLRAIVDAREMAGSHAHLAREVRRRDDLACEYRQVFGRPPPDDDDLLAVDIAKALAAFQQTLVSGRTPFDAFRDALVRDDRAAMARYPAAAQRGLKLFIGRGNCALCHTGPAFSNGEFHDTGVPFFVRPGVVDPGRHLGLRQVQASALNLLGRFNDDPTRGNATATRHAQLDHRLWGAWRTPSLREVAATAPYMHNGSLATLRDVVQHYASLREDRIHADGERLLRALELTEQEIDDLVAFLSSLSSMLAPPGEPPAAPACD